MSGRSAQAAVLSAVVKAITQLTACKAVRAVAHVTAPQAVAKRAQRSVKARGAARSDPNKHGVVLQSIHSSGVCTPRLVDGPAGKARIRGGTLLRAVDRVGHQGNVLWRVVNRQR